MSFVNQAGKTNGRVFIYTIKKFFLNDEIWVREIGWPEFCGFF